MKFKIERKNILTSERDLLPVTFNSIEECKLAMRNLASLQIKLFEYNQFSFNDNTGYMTLAKRGKPVLYGPSNLFEESYSYQPVFLTEH